MKKFLLASTLLVTSMGAQAALGQSDLPLVERRTTKSADTAYRHLSSLPADVLDNAVCIAVLSKDTIGWGLMGAEIGGGLVSCRLDNGGWSAPSYLALSSISLGPNIGLLVEDSTFIFGRSDVGNITATSFGFEAGVFATAGNAHVEASATSDGCFIIDLKHERKKHCTLAVSDSTGLHAGANVTVTLIRHMTGLFGAGRFGRNARVYGPRVSISDILSTSIDYAPNLTHPWIETLNQVAP